MFDKGLYLKNFNAIQQQLIIIGGESAEQETAHGIVEAYHTGSKTWGRFDSLRLHWIIDNKD